MIYRRREGYVGAKIFLLVIFLTVAGVMSGFAMFSMSGQFDSMKANEILININSIAKEAYETSKKAGRNELANK